MAAFQPSLLHCAMALLPCIQAVLSAPANLLNLQATPVPDFVTKYAPVVWLESEDKYFPSDIASQLAHTKPEINFTAVGEAPAPLTLDNLDQLNANDGANVYLTSVDDITTNPQWLNGVKPDGSGKTDGVISCAVIVTDHGNGLVDAFYMYFYAYNWGGRILGQNVGDHVGDWEHTMVRFQGEVPQAVWFSQHAFGEAFTYTAVEKQGDRPVAYSANGSHANYATTGKHDHTIPGFNLPDGPLRDTCDQGTLWDPLLSAYYYTYDPNSQAFSAYDSSKPLAWLKYIGKWGDQQYPDSDKRQHKLLGIDAAAEFVSGPTGPRDKQLDRKDVCPTSNNAICRVQKKLGP